MGWGLGLANEVSASLLSQKGWAWGTDGKEVFFLVPLSPGPGHVRG